MTRKMKDSGVEWIGEIPEEWEMKRIGSIFKQRNEKVSDLEYKPLSVTKNGIVPQLENAAKSSNHNDRKLVRTGDFVINSRSDRKMSSGISEESGSVSLINLVLYSKKMYGGYTNYILKNASFAEEFYKWGTGIVADLWSTKWESMKKIVIPYPNSEEQEKISKEINKKVVMINSIIGETQQSIIELKKYKQSLITETVTKGLDKNVEMKDSGIEWIGKIPESWDSIKLKQLGQTKNGLTYDPSEITDESQGTLVLRSGNIQNGRLIAEDNVYIIKNKISESMLIRPGDILICSRNGSKNLIGKSALIEKKIRASFGAFMMIFRPIKVDSKYIYYLLNSGLFSYYIGSFLTSTINQLTKKNFDNMKIVYTSNVEIQKKLVKFLDEKTSKIDQLIVDKEQLIKEYESYKKSLVYEYVTGKKEV